MTTETPESKPQRVTSSKSAVTLKQALLSHDPASAELARVAMKGSASAAKFAAIGALRPSTFGALRSKSTGSAQLARLGASALADKKFAELHRSLAPFSYLSVTRRNQEALRSIARATSVSEQLRASGPPPLAYHSDGRAEREKKSIEVAQEMLQQNKLIVENLQAQNVREQARDAADAREHRFNRAMSIAILVVSTVGVAVAIALSLLT